MWYHHMLNVIIRTFDIRLLWGHTVVPMGRIKGIGPSSRFPNLLLYESSVNNKVGCRNGVGSGPYLKSEINNASKLLLSNAMATVK